MNTETLPTSPNIERSISRAERSLKVSLFEVKDRCNFAFLQLHPTSREKRVARFAEFTEGVAHADFSWTRSRTASSPLGGACSVGGWSCDRLAGGGWFLADRLDQKINASDRNGRKDNS